MSHMWDELQRELARKRALPTCDACRKKSDGSKRTGTFVLCGTHHDEWLRSGKTIERFVEEMRAGPFKACWEAREEGA